MQNVIDFNHMINSNASNFKQIYVNCMLCYNSNITEEYKTNIDISKQSFKEMCEGDIRDGKDSTDKQIIARIEMIRVLHSIRQNPAHFLWLIIVDW